MIFLVDLAVLLFIGGLICQGVESLLVVGVLCLGFYLVFGLLMALMPALIFIFCLAALIFALYIAGRGLFLAWCWITNQISRRVLLTLYLLCIPVAIMIAAIAFGGMTGDWFKKTEAVHTQETVWFFFHQDVVTYRDKATPWKTMLDCGQYASIVLVTGVGIEFLIRLSSRKKKTFRSYVAPPHAIEPPK